MILYIKYMVSRRCKIIVEQELVKLGLHYISLDLGMVNIMEEMTEEQLESFRENLLVSGLELLDDKKTILIEKIKNVIIEMIHHSEDVPKTNFSTFLSERLGYDYTYLSNIFMQVKGITIQQFILLHKTERVKELLLYDELTLTEIAYRMGYSSVAHLSGQFKKVTGLTPSFYKQIKNGRKQHLEDL